MQSYFQQAAAALGTQITTYATWVAYVLFGLAFLLTCASLGRTSSPPKDPANKKDDREEDL